MANAPSFYGGRRVISAASRQKGHTLGATVGEMGPPPLRKMGITARSGIYIFYTARRNLINPGARNMQRSATPSRAGAVRGCPYME